MAASSRAFVPQELTEPGVVTEGRWRHHPIFRHSSPIPTTQGRGVRGPNSGGARVSRGFSPLAPGQAGGAKADRASKRVVTLNFLARSNLRRNAVGMSEKC